MTRTCDHCARPLPDRGHVPTRRVDDPETGIVYFRYCRTRCKVRSELGTGRREARHV